VNGRTLRWLLSLARSPRAGGRARLTIIRHHRVFPDDARPLYRIGVSASVLEAQLGLLARLGRVPLTVSEGLARAREGRPGHWVAMTFDDGYADNVERALPLLEAAGARATFYLTAGLMETRTAPWWDDLAHRLGGAPGPVTVPFGAARAFELGSHRSRAHALESLLSDFRVPPDEQTERLRALGERTGVRAAAACELATWDLAARLPERGMEIGAHTMRHPYLSLLDEDAQREEIEGSALLIERRLGVRPSGLAYPGGDYDARTVRVVEAAGLAHAVTTRAGDAGPSSPRFELRRRGLSEGACLGPSGRFSARLTRAELEGAFDRLRGVPEAA
jgi:peptidoglycan/xylan/chitin deacetylase (PgdA/CDA1 family)